MRPARRMLVVVLLLAACSGGGDEQTSGTSSAPTPASTTSAPSVTPSPEPSASATPTVEPVVLPPGVPPTYGRDVEPGDLPTDRLVPSGADVTGSFFPGDEAAIVTWAVGDDPFQREQGLVVWRRTAGDAPPWSATFAFRDPPRAGVLGIQVDTGDVTGEGEPDALVFENAGGSGACGTWQVIALSPGADGPTYRTDLCDGSVEPSTDPVGIRLVESIYAPGDPHCCPSGVRISTLEWNGARWRVTAREEDHI